MRNKCENCPQEPKNWSCAGNFENGNYTKESIKEDIIKVMQQFYKQDKYLIDHKVNEVCVSARFCALFNQECGEHYPGLDIDPEYNRSGEKPKYCFAPFHEEKEYARPDLIIHKRGCNKHNILMIEFKPYWGKNNREDLEKLRGFTDSSLKFEDGTTMYSYSYKFGVSIILDEKAFTLQWVQNGEVQEPENSILYKED